MNKSPFRVRALSALAAAGATLLVSASLQVPPARAATATPDPDAQRAVASGAVPRGALVVGNVPPETDLRLTVMLRSRDPGGLARLAEDVSNPASPQFHHYLTTAEFARRFGATGAAVGRVDSWLRAAGMRPGPVSANRLAIPVRAGAGRAARAFATPIQELRLASGGRAYANTRAATVPGTVSRYVQVVAGLDDLPTAHDHLVPRPPGPTPRAGSAAGGGGAAAGGLALSQPHSGVVATAPAAPRAGGPVPSPGCPASSMHKGSYTADQLAAAYGFDSLYSTGSGLLGSGESIALFELEPYSSTDIAQYQQCYGTTTSLTNVRVDNGAGNGAGGGEAALDIEDLIGLAPQASITVYEAPNTNSGLLDEYNRIVTDDTAAVVSSSWGLCEGQQSSSLIQSESTIFQEAAAQGQTVLAAAGDSGSEDCGGSALAVDDPASQPYVTGVGGTDLTAVGPPPAETVWNDSSGAAGGGISSRWPMPPWQKAPGVPSSLSRGAPCGGTTGNCREVPDVSAAASPFNGYVIYYTGSGTGTKGWQVLGGTSAAAPLWGALVALVDQGCSARAGFLNPVLYQAANAGSHAENDVTPSNAPNVPDNNDRTGANGGLYPVTNGYDMATGLGTPIGSQLAASLCVPAVTAVSPASGPSEGGTQVTVTGTGFRSGAGATTVAFGGVPAASVTVQNATTLVATTPSAPGGTADVRVTTPAGTSLVNSADSFVFVAPKTSVTSPSASPTTGAAGATTTYTVQFTTSGSGGLAASGSITISAPAGTTLPSTGWSVTDGGGGTDTAGTATLSKVGGSSTENEAVVPLTASAIGANDPVTLTVPGVTNPQQAAGGLTMQLSTSADTQPVSSSPPYSIVAAATSAARSTLGTQPTTVPANGASSSVVTVSLTDVFGNAESGKSVTLTQAVGGGTGHSTIVATGCASSPCATGTTDAAGQVTYSVTDGTRENVSYAADDTTDGVTVSASPPSGSNAVDFVTSVSPGTVSLLGPAGGPGQAGTDATYTIPFTTSAYGALDTGVGTASITLAAPSGTVFPGQTADYAVSYCLSACGMAGETDAAAVVGSATPSVGNGSSTANDVVIALSTAAITADDPVTVSVSGVSDPDAALTTYALQESTSADTMPAASPHYSVVAGPVSATNSTVSGTPPALVSGVGTATVTVVLSDSFGNRVSGRNVALAAGSGSSVVSGSSGQSSGTGAVTFTVKDAQTEQVTYTATDTTDSVVLTQTTTVAFSVPSGGGSVGGSGGGGRGGGGGGGSGGGGSSGGTPIPVTAGGTASSAPSGTTPGPSTPVIASVTSPVAGTVSFTPGGGTASSGFHLLGSGFQITAPQASASQPLTITFQLAVSELPAGTSAADLVVFRNGSAIAPCSSPTSTTASPDPCALPVALTGGVVSITVLSSHASAWALGTPALSRLSGADREATAIAVSQASFPSGGAGAVVLARADNYPDALAGAALAVARNAPVLLTSPTSLDGTVATELRRVLSPGSTVYLLGGSAALSDGVATSVAGIGYRVTRLAGPDRFATAVAVAQAVGAPRGVLLTTGLNFPDALAAAAAATAGRVILLTDGTGMPAATASYLAAHPVPVWAVGGPAATADPAATRLAGSDRYATAALVAQTFFNAPSLAGIATGSDFPDALAAGPRLARLGAPLLLTDPDTLSSATAAYLGSVGSSLARVEVYGGATAVTDAVAAAAAGTVG